MKLYNKIDKKFISNKIVGIISRNYKRKPLNKNINKG